MGKGHNVEKLIRCLWMSTSFSSIPIAQKTTFAKSISDSDFFDKACRKLRTAENGKRETGKTSNDDSASKLDVKGLDKFPGTILLIQMIWTKRRNFIIPQ